MREHNEVGVATIARHERSRQKHDGQVDLAETDKNGN